MTGTSPLGEILRKSSSYSTSVVSYCIGATEGYGPSCKDFPLYILPVKGAREVNKQRKDEVKGDRTIRYSLLLKC